MKLLQACLAALIFAVTLITATPASSEAPPHACCAGIADVAELTDATDERSAPDLGIAAPPRPRCAGAGACPGLESAVTAGETVRPPHPPPD